MSDQGATRTPMAHPLFDAMTPEQEHALPQRLRHLIAALEISPVPGTDALFLRDIEFLADMVRSSVLAVISDLKAIGSRYEISIVIYARSGQLHVLACPSRHCHLAAEFFFDDLVSRVPAPKPGDAA